MIYLMSDVHGRSDLFFQMLEQAGFSVRDKLYIVGDVVAKGPDAVGILRYVMEHDNVRLLRGNHEARLLQYFAATGGKEIRGPEGIFPAFHGISPAVMKPWIAGDGAPTIGQLKTLPERGRSEILSFLSRTPLLMNMEYHGQKYLLVHGAPKEEGRESDILENRYPFPDAPHRSAADTIVIVGHTPTFKYGEKYAGKMIIRKDKYFLDCGVGQGYGLGCLRLDTMEEFYRR